MELKTIARIHTGFPEKFGIPRQSGLVETPGQIVFEHPYNNADLPYGFSDLILRNANLIYIFLCEGF